MGSIKIAIIGVGNCASSLMQGIEYYRGGGPGQAAGLMHWSLGGYESSDIDVVAAFDIDVRKIGKDISEAIFELPNCTKVFFGDIPKRDIYVRMGRVLDSVASHMSTYPDQHTFLLSDATEAEASDVIGVLRKSEADIMVILLPVGSEEAARFYADCALEAGVAVVNCIPVFLASDPKVSDEFRRNGIPILGDDIKAQLGATIAHRTLTDLFRKRGVSLDRTYQLNTGGNTDFLNMLDSGRLLSKRESKTEAVQSVAEKRMDPENIHVGPSDYVAWQKDNKVCFIRMEGRLFGEIPMNLEMRLSVEDSPNSAGVIIDAIRCAKLALDRGIGGALESSSAFLMKHPPVQIRDDDAYLRIEEFIAGDRDI